VPHPGDETGILVVPLFDAEQQRTAFLLFDPQNVAAGPSARLWLRDAIPPLFHACFEPAGATVGASTNT